MDSVFDLAMLDRMHPRTSYLSAAHVARIRHSGSVSVTWIDLDEDALAAAMRELGTATTQDTVNAALREIASRSRRLAAFHRLAMRPTNQADANDYFARREAAKGPRR